jgi:DNA-binding response OmpR family regulator
MSSSNTPSEPFELLISNATELLSQLRWGGFRRLPMNIRVAATATDILGMVKELPPRAMVLESTLADGDAFAVCKAIRGRLGDAAPAMVVVHDGSIPRAMWPVISASGCDEVLTSPLARGQLYEVLAYHLGLQRRRYLRVLVQASATARDASIEMQGEIFDLSLSGARLRLPVPYSGTRELTLEIEHASGQLTRVGGAMVWQRPYSNGVEMAVRFDALDQEVEELILGLTTWRLEWKDDHQLVVIQQDITEASDFSGLGELLQGRVVFDLKAVKVLNSMGVSRWIKFMRQIPEGVDYSFQRCSPAFCTQAGYLPGMLRQGLITSFQAPYICDSCDREALEEVDVGAMGEASPPTPPVRACRACGAEMEFDEMPERFFLFLR